MRIWAIADLHLSKNPSIEKPMEIFGWNWSNHDSRIEENWIKLVEPQDIVISAGDLSWAMKLEQAETDIRWLEKLPGRKVLVKGNHDLWWQSLSKVKAMSPETEFLQHSAYGAGGAVMFGTRGWVCPGSNGFTQADSSIYRRETMRLETAAQEALKLAELREKEIGVRPDLIGILHYPPSNGNSDETDFTRIFRQTGAKKVVYGHLHGPAAFANGPQGLIDGVEYILTSADKLDFCPLLIWEDVR